MESSVALSFTSFFSFSLERIKDSNSVAPSGIFELIAFNVSKKAA
jgi:hypothetical protein